MMPRKRDLPVDYVPRVSPEKEQVLNPIVARFNLTARSKVGGVVDLIAKSHAKSLEEWEQFYYRSGELRIPLDKNARRTAGRTEDELNAVGDMLFDRLSVIRSVTREDCRAYIKQIVVDFTWIGIAVREKRVLQTLDEQFGITGLVPAGGAVDAEFAVDYEYRCTDGRRIGVQIKPESYFGASPAVQRAELEEKHRKYREVTGGIVVTIIADVDGRIVNRDDANNLKLLIDQCG